MTKSAVAPVVSDFANEVSQRLERLASLAADGGLDAAIGLMTRAIEAGAVIQAFGTGHSEAFAMEIAGRAGGLIPTNKIALRDLVLHGGLTVDALAGSSLERNPDIVAELWEISPIHPGDVFVIASNSGVNGSVVGMALLAKEKGHDVIAVTSLQHTAQVRPKHPSGLRLSEVADVVIDNLAPYGDATLALPGGVAVGSVSSITSAFIAQLLTIGVAERMNGDGRVPPLYLSANIPGGDEHNHALEKKYEGGSGASPEAAQPRDAPDEHHRTIRKTPTKQGSIGRDITWTSTSGRSRDATSSAAHWPRRPWPPPGRSRPAPPRVRAPAPPRAPPQRVR